MFFYKECSIVTLSVMLQLSFPFETSWEGAKKWLFQ